MYLAYVMCFGVLFCFMCFVCCFLLCFEKVRLDLSIWVGVKLLVQQHACWDILGGWVKEESLTTTVFFMPLIFVQGLTR